MPGMALQAATEYEDTIERLNKGYSASQRGQICSRKRGTVALIHPRIDGIPDGDFSSVRRTQAIGEIKGPSVTACCCRVFHPVV